MTAHLMNTYQRLPVTFTRGQGSWLWDDAGERYLDALSGIAVVNLGHAHPAVAQAICQQSTQLLHTSNLYRVAVQEQLAERLTALCGMDVAFFCNSGAEANEAAIKLARRYGHQLRDVAQPAIIVAEKSFHGRTLATLSATGNTKVQQGFEPLVEGFIRVPYGDLSAIAAAFAEWPNIVAVLLEPIQGEGGINIPPDDYLPGVRALCDRYQALLMCDEIQCGMGRSGRFLAHQYSGIVADVCTLAKALANGVPIGACLARGVAASVLVPGSHGSTFGGNPLACRAALATLDVMAQHNVIAQVPQRAQSLVEALRARLMGHPAIVEIRHRGLMIGIECRDPCSEMVKQALARRVLINVTADKVIRLLPTLIIEPAEIDMLADTLAALFAA